MSTATPSSAPNAASASKVTGTKRKIDTISAHDDILQHEVEDAPGTPNAQRESAHTRVIYRPGTTVFGVYKPGVVLDVYIPAKYIIDEVDVTPGALIAAQEQAEKKPERKVKVYGTDIYTDNSDLIAACRHSGLLSMQELEEKLSKLKGISVRIKIHDATKLTFQALLRNGIKSKGMSRYEGNAYSIEEVKIVRDKSQPSRKIQRIEKEKRLAPALVSDASIADQTIPNLAIVYNLSNDPCTRYSLHAISDRGQDADTYTSYRLHRDVLFLDSKTQRFQLSLNADTKKYDFHQVKQPYTLDTAALSKLELPLRDEALVQLLEGDLAWSELHWGESGVSIRGKQYDISGILFVRRTTALPQSA